MSGDLVTDLCYTFDKLLFPDSVSPEKVSPSFKIGIKCGPFYHHWFVIKSSLKCSDNPRLRVFPDTGSREPATASASAETLKLNASSWEGSCYCLIVQGGLLSSPSDVCVTQTAETNTPTCCSDGSVVVHLEAEERDPGLLEEPTWKLKSSRLRPERLTVTSCQP